MSSGRTHIAEVRCKVRGRVQGVGYRVACQRWARQLDVTGFAKNQDDGTVLIVAQGPEAKLVELIRKCYAGPEHARVDDIAVTWQKQIDQTYSGFEIDY